MSYVPRNAAITATWDDLVGEFDRWEAAGRVAALWWRDDDAVVPTAALSELLDLAGDVPIGLAVIPGLARPELASVLCGAGNVARNVTVLQHGWRHVNRASAGKNTEYPDGRGFGAVAAEIGAGRARLRALFEGQAAPIFVPPWNRIAPGLIPALAEAGIVALSAMAPDKAGVATTMMPTRHVHLDVTAWKDGRGFVGTGMALSRLIGRLRQLRVLSDPVEPVGILTHHLVMDRPTAEFLRQLLVVTTAHQAVRWLSPTELMP